MDPTFCRGLPVTCYMWHVQDCTAPRSGATPPRLYLTPRIHVCNPRKLLPRLSAPALHSYRQAVQRRAGRTGPGPYAASVGRRAAELPRSVVLPFPLDLGGTVLPCVKALLLLAPPLVAAHCCHRPLANGRNGDCCVPLLSLPSP
jgi:hypothetical protein